ncbi:pyrimidine 5'-nucleotidase [Phenylobacterium montanum]|uniref:Pyrimidine 5'-nucleotidase n=1 Tax=Phenylobacterium montanum TaxID=2823693 RepID=A0A975FZ64_9CAUL|nr:pyrimidine 5'-nucleotidase [Caulobacter sp. S6]QUD87669.1 pyrimidine 5'-nucleotidase [Caulobacter sp. S6]
MTPESSPDLAHIDVWLFDLDNTLYPAECEFMALIEARMTDFMQRETGLERTEARALQKKYLHEHGTTLAGLMANHGVDPELFLDEVHDVSMDGLTPDPALRAAIERLPGRRLIFTNGDARHADRVLEKLDLADQFEAVFHIASADYVPKPNPGTFRRMIEAHDIDPLATCFFEDSEKNLAPAAGLGMTTVLVGAHAARSDAAFVQYRTETLAPFLAAARLKQS